ncbi:carboxynorspermidine decarboxylase [Methylomonas sp. HYX-M1]|uniref:carboxynorspermidine decarboxylase n=1 Tax=Methylomonas sp. HYX-M1 TaxID=3139307 RepID=UPI00345B9503
MTDDMLALENFKPRSPAFVLDLDRVHANLQALQAIRTASACKLLYSVKALPLASLIAELSDLVDGFSASSLFEAKLCREAAQNRGSLHLTTPGIRPDEFSELASLCSHVSFNSLNQFAALYQTCAPYSAGLRVNPKVSQAADQRYDPCRRHSKLGVAIEALAEGLPAAIAGLHVHNAFGQTAIQPLRLTLQALQPVLARCGRLRWLNLGGGYLYHSMVDHQQLSELIAQLRADYADEVYLEPGNAIVGNAGYLYATIIDRFVSDGETVLILDTSVNHLPEVFEYQLQPELLQASPSGDESAIVAGCTCLAGDVFGAYRFRRLPEIGETLTFAQVGAYSLIKAHRFNGHPLPAIYLKRGTALHLVKTDCYAAYRAQWLSQDYP